MSKNEDEMYAPGDETLLKSAIGYVIITVERTFDGDHE